MRNEMELVTNIAALENLFKSDLFASVAKTWLFNDVEKFSEGGQRPGSVRSDVLD